MIRHQQDAIGVGRRQRPEQNRLDDRENRSIGADANGERQYRRCRVRAIFPQQLQTKREAELLATLNHPRIAQIYGFEEAGETACLVLELVEGETLADELKRGPIPLERALQIAQQITEALEAAHEREIIHRDLKPANIKITPDGNVKVLDFGLAKAIAPPGGNSTESRSPTFVSGASLPGVILGTAAYMSPEQAKGHAADRRSDIWAFACVFYEMVAGQMAFSGESIVEILSAVLRAEPDWTALPESTPAAIRSLLKRCLQKDRSRRLRDIVDARFQIEESQSAPDVSEPAAPAQRVSRERRPQAPQAPEMRLQIVTPPEASNSSFAPSPDGQKLVFLAQGQYWLRPLNSEKADPLPGTENGGSLFWSPDNRSFAFSASDHLKRFDFDLNLARTIADVSGTGTRSGSWNTAGNLLISRRFVRLVSPCRYRPKYLWTTPSAVRVYEPRLRLRLPRTVRWRIAHAVSKPNLRGSTGQVI